MSKKTVILYDSWGEIIKNLPAEQAGEIAKALCKYAFDGEHPSFDDPVIFAIFAMMKAKVDEDTEAYEEEIKRRSEAGKKGMSKRWDKEPITNDNTVITEDNTDITNDNSDKQSITNITDSVSVSVSDSVSVSVNDKEIGTRKRGPFTPPTTEEVKAYCQERKNNVDAERFVDFYTQKGWVVGRSNTKMKDWKAAVRLWEKTEIRETARSGTTKEAGYIRQTYDFDRIEDTLIAN